MIVFAVDPGVKNMGYACYDTKENKFIAYGKFDMRNGVKRVERTKYAYLTKRFCDAFQTLLKRADIVLIEAQMQAKMKVIQTAMQCFFWEKSKIIGPLAVRRFFNISTSNYKLNKKKSIELVQTLVPEALERFKKKDDVADAIILAKYWDLKQKGITYMEK